MTLFQQLGSLSGADMYEYITPTAAAIRRLLDTDRMTLENAVPIAL